jgi:hypothetical protein
MFGLKNGMDATGGEFNRLRRGVSPLVCDRIDIHGIGEMIGWVK